MNNLKIIEAGFESGRNSTDLKNSIIFKKYININSLIFKNHTQPYQVMKYVIVDTYEKKSAENHI